VLEQIAAGRTNAETAQALGIRLSTVRTHLLHLFDKTRTHRQSELAALVASFSLPLG
jgi:DNA-binding CsgD family transcriptional regulator